MERNSGSSTGLSTLERWPPRRASRARIPPEEDGRLAGAAGREEVGAGRAGVAPEGVERLSGAAAAAVGTTSSGKDTPRGTWAGPLARPALPRTTGRG
ncbi:hypothetical protein GCM10010505_31100 [Kitasatospora aburaviensis]